ncbi:MAG: aminopeptidase P family protein [Planctomycetaceae bacterium]|nr:aminopeptidase P family protein [Planctomycetaceae bacterium]
MLSEEGCLQRRQRLWHRIPEQYQWVLIGDPRHVQYLCNFRVNPISFSADQRPLLLLTRNQQATLLADNFVRRSGNTDVFIDQEIIVPWYTHRKSVTNRDACLATAVREAEPLWVGSDGLIESEAIPQHVFELTQAAADTTFVDAESSENSAITLGTLIRQLRRRKLADEIHLLERCMRACDAGHEHAFDVIRPGITELDVFLEVQKAAQHAAGCPCIVYGDFRATNAKIHKAGGHPTHYELRSGDLFILDYSVVIHGYRSDFTNTIAVGEPTPQQSANATACIAALQAAAAELRPNIECRRIYEAASAVLQQHGLDPLAHHAGHGLGMEHPEPPILVPESTDSLVEGDVITLEPGCYVPGVGGMRFEHNYSITGNGARQLSNHVLGLQR